MVSRAQNDQGISSIHSHPKKIVHETQNFITNSFKNERIVFIKSSSQNRILILNDSKNEKKNLVSVLFGFHTQF